MSSSGLTDRVILGHLQYLLIFPSPCCSVPVSSSSKQTIYMSLLCVFVHLVFGLTLLLHFHADYHSTLHCVWSSPLHFSLFSAIIVDTRVTLFAPVFVDFGFHLSLLIRTSTSALSSHSSVLLGSVLITGCVSACPCVSAHACVCTRTRAY